MDSAAVLRRFPAGNRVSSRDRPGEGWRAHVRIPQLDHSCKGEGQVDPAHFPSLKERRYPRRLKASLVPGLLMTFFMIHDG